MRSRWFIVLAVLSCGVAQRATATNASLPELPLWKALPSKATVVLDDQRHIVHREAPERRKRPMVSRMMTAGDHPERTMVLEGKIEPYDGVQRWHVDSVLASRPGLPWVRSQQLPDLIEGRGTPPFLLTALAHLKTQGLTAGELGMLTLDVQSPDAIMEYAEAARQFDNDHGARPDDPSTKASLLRTTKMIRSFESVLELSGHRVREATLYDKTRVRNLGQVIDWFAYDPHSSWGATSFAPGWEAKARRLWPTLPTSDINVESDFKLVLYLEPSR